MSENVYNSALTGPQLDEALQTAAQLVVSGLSVERGGTGAKTAEQARSNLGAAPVGYGLGGTATWIPDSDALKGYNANGWYYWSASNTDPDKPFAAGSMLSVRRSLSHWTQLAFEDGSHTGGIRVRKIIDGNAQPWEWVNPPMVVGMEYRTTERWQGKVVYTSLVNCGTINPGENVITTALTCSMVIRHSGVSGSYDLPLVFESARNDDYGKWSNVRMTGNRVEITIVFGTKTAASAYNYMQVWYTKD